jgi:predicted transcriptional regulator
MNDSANDRNVDQIRDILFGGQMRDYERRFQDLSQRLESESQRLHSDLDKRLGQLDKRVDDQFEKLAKQLRQEIADRTQGIDDLETRMQQGQRSLRAELQGGLQALEADLAAKDERQREGLSEVRQLMAARVAEISAALGRAEQDLRGDKVGRADLAALLTEVALRLNGEFELPTARK